MDFWDAFLSKYGPDVTLSWQKIRFHMNMTTDSVNRVA